MSDITYKVFILAFFITNLGSIHAQTVPYPYDIPKYEYIRYNDNYYQFYDDSAAFQRLYQKYYDLILTGTGNISIVHIGGSHIQADIYTHIIREKLQTIYNGSSAARGFVFPYKVARTNNPKNYEVRYTGLWQSCSNVEKNKYCRLGLSGMSVTTYDTTASIFVSFSEENEIRYYFNKLKVFHEQGPEYFDFTIEAPDISTLYSQNDSLGYTEILFDDNLGGLLLKVAPSDTMQSKFTVYGLSFESDEPGILYHAVGVNGAGIPSYLKCALFSIHLQALNPDMVVVSLGTNDAYTRNFNTALYKDNYRKLIHKIQKGAPDASLLLTVPNDSYLYRRYINQNTEKMEKAIKELAKEYGCGVWDFYHIMGGLNSAYAWHKDGLMRNDRVHFTKEGYLMKGDLFFNAFLRGFDAYVDAKNEEGKTSKY